MTRVVTSVASSGSWCHLQPINRSHSEFAADVKQTLDISKHVVKNPHQANTNISVVSDVILAIYTGLNGAALVHVDEGRIWLVKRRAGWQWLLRLETKIKGG